MCVVIHNVMSLINLNMHTIHKIRREKGIETAVKVHHEYIQNALTHTLASLVPEELYLMKKIKCTGLVNNLDKTQPRQDRNRVMVATCQTIYLVSSGWDPHSVG